MGTIKRKDAIKNKYSFIKRIDGKLSLVDKDYNILIHDVEIQPDLFEWIEKNNLWNHPNGILESEKYQQIRNPEGMKTIHKAFNWAGNVTGGALAGVALAPSVLASAPTISNFLIRDVRKPVLQTLGRAFDPTNYVGAGVTSYFGADALNNFTNNPNLENGIQVGLTVTPFAFKGLQKTKEIGQKAFNFINENIYDPYTTINGRFGNYSDNTLTNIRATLARRFPSLEKYDKARTPMFFRKLRNPANFENGRINLTGKSYYDDLAHTNFTTDRPVVANSGGSWDDAHLYVVNGDDVLSQTTSQTLKSVEPSDTFVHGTELTFNPKRVTFVSGNKDLLQQAKSQGLQTLSSKRLRDAWQNSVNTGKYSQYSKELQRLVNTYGRPYLKDYSHLQNKTGLNPYVAPITELTNYNDSMMHMQPYDYPNGNPAFTSVGNRRAAQEADWANVFYDPASTVEEDLMFQPSIIDPKVYREATSIGTQFYPNQKDIFKYNGYLDSHFYSDNAKQVVDQFGNNIKQLQESLKTLGESDKVYVRNFLKSKAFANNNVPYYTTHRELLNDHPKIKAALDEQPEVKRRFQNDIDNVVIDIGDDFGVLVKEPDQITHEFTHVLQKKKDYLPEQKDLLNKAYVHSKDSTLPTGKIDEKGAVNQQLRTLIINEYKDSYGRYPEVQELQDYIDEYPDHALKNLLENYTNLYGQEYVNNNSNMKLVKKALKWVGATLPFTTLDSKKGESR